MVNVGQIIQGGMQILSGFASHRMASQRARFAHQINERKVAFNLRQLTKAYKENYAKNMIEFADANVSLNTEFRNAKSNIALMAQQQGMNGIDIQASSLYQVAKSTLDNEYNQSINRIIADASLQGNDLYQGLVREQLGVEMAGIENRFQISHQKLQAQQQAGMEILQGMVNVGVGAMGAFGSSQQANVSGNVGNNLPTVQSGYNSMSQFGYGARGQGLGGFNPNITSNIKAPNLSQNYNINKYR